MTQNSDPRQATRFYLAAIILVLFGIGIHISDMRKVGLVVNDDRTVELGAIRIENGGLAEYQRQSYNIARRQGKAGLLFGYSLLAAPYFLDPSVRPYVVSAIHLLTFLMLCFFVALYLGLPTALLILVGLLCFLPNSGRSYPVAAYPIEFHAAIILFLFGYTLHLLSFRVPIRPALRPLLTPVIVLSLLASLCVYEALYVAFGIIEIVVLISLIRQARRAGVTHPFFSALRSDARIISVFLFYIAAYIVFRHFHPVGYPGTTLKDGPFHFISLIKAAFIYAFAGLPGGNWFVGDASRLASVAVQSGGGWWAFFWRYLGWQEVVLFFGVTYVFWLYLRHIDTIRTSSSDAGRSILTPTISPIKPGTFTALSVAGAALCIAYVAQVPISMVPRYQHAPFEWAPHVTSYFAFLGVSVAIPALLFAFRKLTKRPYVAVSIALLAGGLALISRQATALVYTRQESSYTPWRLIDIFLKSRQFDAIPNGSVIVAPTLWDKLTPDLASYENYWRQYVFLHSRRSIDVVRLMPAVMPAGAARLYYLELQELPESTDACLLFETLSADPGQKLLQSRAVTVISSKSFTGDALVLLHIPDSGPMAGGLNSSNILKVVRLLPIFDRSAFVNTVNLPEAFMPGSVYVVSSAAVSANKLLMVQRGFDSPAANMAGDAMAITFDRGFYGEEASPEHHWHWSSGPSGTGYLTLWNKTSHPLKARFQASILTQYSKPAQVEVSFNNKVETLTVTNGIVFRRTWLLKPGGNFLVIHSYAPRVDAPKDPRYIMFGVYDWELSPGE